MKNTLASRHWWFRALCITFLGSIFIGGFFSFWTAFILLSIILGIAAILWTHTFLWIFCIALLGIGIGSRPINLPQASVPNNLESTFIGYVDNFPDIRKSNTRVPFVIESTDNTPSSSFRVLAILPPDTLYIDYGDTIQIVGELQTPRSFSGFNYQSYLARHGISHLLAVKNSQDITLLEKGNRGNWIIRSAKQVRNLLASNLSAHLPSPHDQILMGILLGVKNELPENTLTSFKQSGLQHILVVSGFNVTVIMFVVLKLLRRLGRPISVTIAILILIFYTAMTGFDMPVVRAALMGSIVGFTLAIGRFNEGIVGLLLSLVFLGIIQPSAIQSDVSLHLSSAATLGILILFPRFESRTQHLPNPFELRTLILTGLCAQIAVTPVIGWYFEETQAIGLLSNLFVEPLIPISMGIGAIVAFIGFLPSWIMWIFSIPAFLVTEGILWIAVLFDRFPTIPVPPIAAGILGIVVFGYMIWEILRIDTSHA